jgi:hypothetical protein
LDSLWHHERLNFRWTWSFSLFDWSWQPVLMGSCKAVA